jgi:apolipoprotein N-acyltransferase
MRDIGRDFIFGSPAFQKDSGGRRYLNSAYLVYPDQTVAARYDKSHLVPFGEYVPLGINRWLPFLNKLVQGVGDFAAGEPGRPVAWRGREVGILICYEVIFPELARAVAANGAQLLVNITNDAWYGRSSAPYQHFSMAVFRAVETRRALVRAANTGISGFIDPVGRIVAATPIFQEEAMTRAVPLMNLSSIYTRWGDGFAIACLLVTLIAAGAGVWGRRRS